jgi:hypothetical protein
MVRRPMRPDSSNLSAIRIFMTVSRHYLADSQ